jgi:RNA polymerase sigma factor (sigma-70 family)
MEADNLGVRIGNFERELVKYVNSLNLDIEEQDLVKETFLKGIVRRSGLRSENYLKDWTCVIHRKAFINNYRRIMLQNRTSDPQDLFLNPVSVADEDVTQVFNEIVGEIDHLNIKLIRPFKMYVEGYNYKEIADTVNLRLETVKKRIFIARSQLILLNTRPDCS